MKKALFTAAILSALTVGAASAMTDANAQLVAAAQNNLDVLGFVVDADTLSVNQLAGIVSVTDLSDRASEARSLIGSIIR